MNLQLKKKLILWNWIQIHSYVKLNSNTLSEIKILTKWNEMQIGAQGI
jgi:hypothetical protein